MDVARTPQVVEPDLSTAKPPSRIVRWLGMTAHLGLLLAVLVMVVFLVLRHGPRVDLTSEGLYSLTGATRQLLERLDDRLRIEVYLSRDEELGANVREARRTFRFVLDEFAQRGRGKVTVRYFDPQADEDVRQRAERLGIKPQVVRDLQGTTLSQKEIWQGVRLLYGGTKQKVLRTRPTRTAAYEVWRARIRQVSLREPHAGRRRRTAAQPPAAVDQLVQRRRARAHWGYAAVPETPENADRYEVVPLDLSEGQSVPADLDTVVLIRPRALTDRQKFVLDQFLMRGGKLAVFADTADIALGRRRSMEVQEASWDAKDSTVKFLDQLDHYGIDVSDDVVFDLLSEGLPFVVTTAAPPGTPVPTLQLRLEYPYWFQPSRGNWADQAESFARREDGRVDPQLAESYREVLKPGLSESVKDVFLPPVMFWPCSVELAEGLGPDVGGEVLMRTSPRAARHDPAYHRDLRPVRLGDFDEREYLQFQQRTVSFLRGERETARQYGLMAEVHGQLRSYFANRPVPRKPGDEPAATGAGTPRDPLAEPVGADPLEAEPLGPTPGEAGAATPATPPEPVLVRADAKSARLVVIGDCDMLRDDLVSGEYQQLGGPVSMLGRLFFLNLLDWLAGNAELMSLRARAFVDRTQRYVDATEIADKPPRQQEEARRGAMFVVRLWNVLLPPVLLLCAWAAIAAVRSARKRLFLRSLEDASRASGAEG
ncbi:MAG: Gldg family protein [Planctomycetes bacterium]|nr:Gldg family protein [Planctomycetota bacterium]